MTISARPTTTDDAMTTLLLADDDEALCGLLVQYLELDNYHCTCVNRGDEVIPRLQAGDVDLLVLDIMLPGDQGLDVLRKMRDQRLATPVIMLTARGDDMDRIIGLELGADDYLAKPCNPRELSARIKAVLRRVRQTTAADNLRFGPFLLEPRQRRLLAEMEGGSEEVKLTAREFELLQALAGRCGEVLTKEELSERVLQRALEPFDRSLDMHVSHLRKKLGEYSSREFITTVRGVGYSLNDEAASP